MKKTETEQNNASETESTEEKASETKTAQNEAKVHSPQTGDNILKTIAIAVTSVLCLAVISKKNKKVGKHSK